jgi:hypothetical protein
VSLAGAPEDGTKMFSMLPWVLLGSDGDRWTYSLFMAMRGKRKNDCSGMTVKNGSGGLAIFVNISKIYTIVYTSTISASLTSYNNAKMKMDRITKAKWWPDIRRVESPDGRVTSCFRKTFSVLILHDAFWGHSVNVGNGICASHLQQNSLDPSADLCNFQGIPMSNTNFPPSRLQSYKS